MAVQEPAQELPAPSSRRPVAPSPRRLAGETPAWLHWLAVLTVVATFPLLLLGAEVTTHQWGMVDPRGFRAPWHLTEVSWVEKGLAYVVEHSHRLAGFVVGTCAILLAAGLWWREPRRWVCWLGTAGLLGVCVQGLLGIGRVELHAIVGRDIALVHGTFAQLVVAVLVSVAVVTSRAWRAGGELSPEDAPSRRLRGLSLAAVGVVYLQVVLGAVVRHRDQFWGARAHLLAAFAVVAVVAWLVKAVLDDPRRTRQETWAVVVLGCVTALQLLLGVEAWLTKFGTGTALEVNQLRPLDLHSQLVRSVHFVTGALVFFSAVTAAWQVQRRALLSARARRAEGPA